MPTSYSSARLLAQTLSGFLAFVVFLLGVSLLVGSRQSLVSAQEPIPVKLEKHKHGLSVAVGIWLGYERHGFDYADQTQIDAQYKMAIDAVEKFKNHPAVLVWGIGNEMENWKDGDNPDMWKHVEKIAAKIKQIDPSHPTMTVIAGIGKNKVPALHMMCPSIDIVGINSYGEALEVPAGYRKLGGTKTYIMTEFGPYGTWEVPKNNIESLDEKTSTGKAATYLKTHQMLKANTELCLGSYAFLWGNKQEGTVTWFGLLLPDGKKTAAVDTLTEQWSGKPPSNLCPLIESLTLHGSNEVEPGTKIALSLKATDPEGQPLNIRWELLGESEQYVTSGDFQATPSSFNDKVISSGDKATIEMPKSGGLYRIYAFVDDGKDGGAVANIPVRIKGSGTENKAASKLPFVLFDEPGGSTTYAASGWMGNTAAIKMNLDCQTEPISGQQCIEVKYNADDEWGGVVWQSPQGDWGDKDGGLDLTGSKKLTFFARGNAGGEEVKFGFGLLGTDKKYHDTVKDEMTVKLAPRWKQYSFDVSSASPTMLF